jgi:citrate lyase alpha subunit
MVLTVSVGYLSDVFRYQTGTGGTVAKVPRVRMVPGDVDSDQDLFDGFKSKPNYLLLEIHEANN